MSRRVRESDTAPVRGVRPHEAALSVAQLFAVGSLFAADEGIDEEDEKFNKKWSSVLRQTDRYYNRNLTKRDTNFTILSSMELKNEDL